MKSLFEAETEIVMDSQDRSKLSGTQDTSETFVADGQGRETLKTLVVSILCLCGAGAGGFSLYRDFNASGVAGLGAPLASVERRESKVRRKAASNYVWTAVRPKENLYRRDSIQTASGSAARIQYVDGSRVEIGENSLVVIDDVANLALNFKSGSVVVRKKDGTDTKITIERNGQAKFEDISVRMIRPEPQASFFAPEKVNVPIDFAWEPKNVASDVREELTLQVSPDRNFHESKTQRFPIADLRASKSLRANFSSGNYFWRIVRKNQPLTEISPFKILPALALKPVWPNLKEKIVRWGEENQVQFRWLDPVSHLDHQSRDESVKSLAEHELQLASDPQFKSVVASEAIEAEQGSTLLGKIADGTYYWRIKSRFGELAVLSPVEKFQVEHGKKIEIKLDKPEADASLELRSAIDFGWKVEAEHLIYRWQLKTADGRTVSEFQGERLSYPWGKTEPGAYQWKVSALDPQGHLVGETAWRAFSIYPGKSIALISPAPKEEILYWEAPPEFEFKWQKDSVAETQNLPYEIEIAKDAAFSQKVKSQTSKIASVSSKTLALPAGTFFWRVKVLDGTGRALKMSETSNFTYQTFPTLKPPVAMAPLPGTTFNLVEMDGNPTLNWDRAEGATAYDVTVYRSADGRAPATAGGKAIAFHQMVSGNRVELKGLPAGKYLWSVRSLDKIKRVGNPTEVREFEISLGAPLGAPESTTVEVQ